MRIKIGKEELEKILFIGDPHHPYVDRGGWKLTMRAGGFFKPDHVILTGDYVDFYSISSYGKCPERALKLKEEVELSKQSLDEVIALGAKNNVFIAGNHCDRMERYLRDKAPELYNFISIPKILGLEERGFKYVPYRDHYTLGKLRITHDIGKSGRYAHYNALDTFQRNIVTGHTHRLGYVVEGNGQGDRHVSASFGWLGDINQVDYMHKIKAVKDWTLGFGIGYLDKKVGTVYIVPVPIIKNTCVIEGYLI